MSQSAQSTVFHITKITGTLLLEGSPVWVLRIDALARPWIYCQKIHRENPKRL
jgi:hypothetical protein